MKLDIALTFAPFAVWDSLASAGLVRREVDGFSILPDETRAERRRQLAAERQRGGHHAKSGRASRAVRGHSVIGPSAGEAELAAAPQGAGRALERSDRAAARTGVDLREAALAMVVDDRVDVAPHAHGWPADEGGDAMRPPSESPGEAQEPAPARRSEAAGATAGAAGRDEEGSVGDQGARGPVREGRSSEPEPDPWGLSGDPLDPERASDGAAAHDSPTGCAGERSGDGASIQQGAAAGTGDPPATFALALTPAAARRTRAEISAAAQQRREREAREKADRAAQRDAKRRAPKPKPAGVEYAEEYAEGQREASGHGFPVPTATHVFWPILRAYAHENGVLFEGARLRQWIRESSAEYRRAMAESPFEKGYSPQKWGEWLQGGKKPYRGRGGAGRFMQKVADVRRNGALPNLSEQLAAAGDI